MYPQPLCLKHITDREPCEYIFERELTCVSEINDPRYILIQGKTYSRFDSTLVYEGIMRSHFLMGIRSRFASGGTPMLAQSLAHVYILGP